MSSKRKTRKAKTIIRTVFLGVTVLNQFLSSAGALNECISNQTILTIYNVASVACTAVASTFAWWFNNSFTEAAQLADSYLDSIKEKEGKCE